MLISLVPDHGLVGVPAGELLLGQRCPAGGTEPVLDRAEPATLRARQRDLVVDDQARDALLLVPSDDAQLLLRVHRVAVPTADPADLLHRATHVPRPVFRVADRDIVGVTRIRALVLEHVPLDLAVEDVVDQVAQPRARRRALRQPAVVGDELRQQRRALRVPADASEVLLDALGRRRREKILDIQLDHDRLADVHRGVVRDRDARIKTHRTRVCLEITQQPAEDRALQGLGVVIRDIQPASAATLLGDARLSVNGLESTQLRNVCPQAKRQRLDVFAQAFFGAPALLGVLLFVGLGLFRDGDHNKQEDAAEHKPEDGIHHGPRG